MKATPAGCFGDWWAPAFPDAHAAVRGFERECATRGLDFKETLIASLSQGHTNLLLDFHWERITRAVKQIGVFRFVSDASFFKAGDGASIVTPHEAIPVTVRAAHGHTVQVTEDRWHVREDPYMTTGKRVLFYPDSRGMEHVFEYVHKNQYFVRKGTKDEILHLGRARIELL